MPKIVDPELERARIRTAARGVFAQRGLARTGLTHVARAAGIGRATLYHYFSDKNELVKDLAAELLEEEEQLFAQALADGGPVVARIERLADAVVDRFAAWADHGGALLEAWAGDPGSVRSVIRKVRRELASLIRRAQRDGEISATARADELALMVVALIDGLMLQVYLDPKGVPPAPQTKRALRDALRRVFQLASDERPS